MSCPDCDCIEIGDVVEHKMNTNVFGIVIGFMGSIVIIRVSPTLDVLQFHEWELQVVDDDEIPPPQSAEQPVPDNVVQVDFTKKRRLRPDTTTEGAA
ncbi:hypothetical protein CO659_12915 [Rhizobium sp. S9]|nr:hypothetical protein CO659_12915 [Rhizobium sp. S9]